MNIVFLVDGFNLYHSLIDVERRTEKCVKWLSLKNLCTSYLPSVSKDAQLHSIYYFSAYAKHRMKSDSNVINRHKIYIQALESTGVKTILGQFKRKKVKCTHCAKDSVKHEEKETDVSIASYIFYTMHQRDVDHIFLITGDTDLIPAIKIAKKLYSKPISVIFPYNRVNLSFKKHTTHQIKIKLNTYEKHLFPETLHINNRSIYRPKEWG